MTEHNNPAGAPVASAVDRDALREQLFKAAHPLTSKWGWFPAEKHAGEIADATLAVAQPVLERQAAELADVWASREAWALEADRLDVIATAACLVTHPRECGRDESDCTNDDSCPRAEERYATADDLIGVTALSEEVARLTRERDEALRAGPAVHAGVLAKPDGVLYALLLVWLDSPMNRKSPESAADAAVSAVNWFLRAASVSGSDTTEDER